MDFKNLIAQLSDNIGRYRENIITEEATKTAFIMPLIAALGYDVFNPLEVIPELDCDLVKKKGEKVDYAIIKDGNPIILIECKHWEQNLDLHNSQLKKYFVASNTRFGVLTNGIEYRFYTDLDKANIMDEKPFLILNMLDISDNEIEQLRKFHKSYYNENEILSTAQELKYTTELRSILNSEFNSPSGDFVRFLTRQIYDGVVSQRIIEQFTPIVKKATASIINDIITSRLGLAIKSAKEGNDPQEANPEATEGKIQSLPEGVVYMSEDGSIITTQEEMDSFYIVKNILREIIDISRVAHRDTQSYFGILLDDNNRKPICRLKLDRKNSKYLFVCNTDNYGTKHRIESLDDIYKYATEIKAAVLRHDSK